MLQLILRRIYNFVESFRLCSVRVALYCQIYIMAVEQKKKKKRRVSVGRPTYECIIR
jgi:hypothetical protein